MAERQDEILAEGVEQPKVMSLWWCAMDRLAAHVAQRVVHEAHVPLEAEAEPALMDRLRHLGPGGRFLGDHHRRPDAP
jgi:hypothetical protein